MKNKHILVVISIISAIAIYIFVVLRIYFTHYKGFSTNADWGTFGDYFGGTLNPILSFLSLIAVLYTITLQTHELKLSREEIERSIKKDEDKDLKILNTALLNISLQLNTINNIKILLSNFETLDEKAFCMPAVKNFYTVVKIDINEIALILFENPQLLLELHVEQEGFLQTLESLRIRNEHFLNKLQPVMAELGLLDRLCNTEEYKEKIPYPIYKAAYQSVSILIENVEKSETGLKNKFEELRVASKKIYPKYKFIKLE
jgi:uncharacterized membrane protein